MADEHTLQVGDEVVLGEDTCLTVLAIEGESVVLGLAAPPSARVTLVGAPEEHPTRPSPRGPRPVSNPPHVHRPRPWG